jgi:hypothetical protein
MSSSNNFVRPITLLRSDPRTVPQPFVKNGDQESIQTSTFGPPSAVGRRPSGYFEFKHTKIMLTAITKRPFSDDPKYQHLQLVTAVKDV